MSTPLTTSRINVIDALRGFALIGIAIAHMTEQYLGGPPPSNIENFGMMMPADGIVAGLTFLLIRGKFFAIFSLLFGLSFFIQMDRGAAKDPNYRGRFVWRLVLLFIIGFGHHMLYRGDILTIYALIGLPLVLFRRVPDRWLWVAIVFLVFGSKFLVLAAKLQLGLDDPLLAEASTAQNDVYYETIKNGSLWEVMKANAGFGFISKMSFQVDVFGRAYQTLALFLAGLWLGRRGWFHQAADRKRTWKRITWIGLTVSLVALVPTVLIMSGVQGMEDTNNWPSMIGFGFYDLHNWGLTAFFIGGFVLLYLRPNTQKWLSGLAPYGRMGLSNYVFQTLCGVLIFFGFGLGFIGEMGTTAALSIAIVVTIFQIWVSKWWLKRYHYGPLEWLWRCGTYMKWQPLKREAQTEEKTPVS